MALDGNRLGTAIANTIRSFRPAAGVAVSDAVLEQMWQAVANDIVNEIKTNGDIDLEAADITVPALGLFDSVPAPVTGSASSAPTGPLTGRIK